MATKPPTKTVYRDSGTGQWTPKANVKRDPDGTQTETRPVRNPPSKPPPKKK
jgi:hypothetical protein